MTKFTYALAAAALMLGACANSDKFSVEINVPHEFMGSQVAIFNAVTRDTVATAVANDTVMTITGTIKQPIMALASIQGVPVDQFVLEPGTLTPDSMGLMRGTKQNDEFAALVAQLQVKAEDIRLIEPDQRREAYEKEVLPLQVNFIKEHPHNLYNRNLFLDMMPMLDEKQIAECMDADTTLAAIPEVQSTLLIIQKRNLTSKGRQYVDATITQADSTAVKLSDYIEPGKITVVDFWASWCRPCMEEIPNLIDIYNKYHAKGVNVLGIALNDKPEDSRKAMADLGIKYPVILNAGEDVANLYGIQYIPTILVIGPDGTILDRDVTGEQLQQSVAAALASK